jgi:hypothetical protein
MHDIAGRFAVCVMIVDMQATEIRQRIEHQYGKQDIPHSIEPWMPKNRLVDMVVGNGKMNQAQ